MATIKLEILTSKKLKKDDDRHPINIIVRKGNSVPARKKVGAAHLAEWDEQNGKIKSKGRPDHVLDNNHIEDEFDKYSAVFKTLVRSGLDWEPEDIFKEVKKEVEKKVTFFGVADEYMSTLIKGSGMHDTARARLEKVKRYKSKDFLLTDIDEAWILGFIHHCKTKEKNKDGEIGNAKNTINQSIKFIKRVVSFTGMENPALKKTKLSRVKPLKTKLDAEELKRFAELELTPGTIRYHARNIFLVQFYFRGMRIGDALRLEPSDIIGNRLQYDAKKTSVEYNMKIVKPCMDVLKEYLEAAGPGDYVFPILRIHESKSTLENFKNEIKNRTQAINWHLNEIAISCEIDKKISTHIARHTFGILADQQLGGNLKTLQALFGHSSRAMTEEYIRELRKTDDLDDAADKVLL